MLSSSVARFRILSSADNSAISLSMVWWLSWSFIVYSSPWSIFAVPLQSAVSHCKYITPFFLTLLTVQMTDTCILKSTRFTSYLAVRTPFNNINAKPCTQLYEVSYSNYQAHIVQNGMTTVQSCYKLATSCSMLTVLLANSSTCKFYCCYLYCRIPLLVKSTAYITLNFHYLQIQPPLLPNSITCKFSAPTETIAL